MKSNRKSKWILITLSVVALLGATVFYSTREKREVVYQEVQVTKGPIKKIGRAHV